MINTVNRLRKLKNDGFIPKRFLDIGAHFGSYSKMIKEIWSDVDVFMIEANPNNEENLKKSGFNYIISLLTDKKAEIFDFYINKLDINSTGCSIYRENTHHFSDENLEVIKLKSNTLDDLFIDQKFDLIKIDTQGSELDILKGGLNLVKRCQYIILETSLINYNFDAPLIDDVLNFMKSINYKMIDIVELHYIDNKLIQIDILFENKIENKKKNMITTIFQSDKNYKEKDFFLKRNIKNLELNDNNYKFCIDDEDWGGYVPLKIIKLLDILKEYPDDEIIMYIDALDTLVVASDEEIEEKFLKFNVDVLYSTERGCWPDGDLRRYFEDKYFLNSGTIIFKNKKYQEILEVLKILYNERLKFSCDQYYHTVFKVINSIDVKIGLDKNKEIFQCLFGENLNNFEKINNRFKNKITNTLPCVFHGNGTDGKEKLGILFGYNDIKISFLGFTNNRMGINFMNSSHIYEDINVYAEIKNKLGRNVYSTKIALPYNVSMFISAEIKDDYTFTIYDLNNNILLREKNY
jgi:FkbM family methyltransferase